MTRNQIQHKLAVASANVVYGGYSVDHVHFDNGSAALRVYDAERGLYNLTYCFKGNDPVDVSAIKFEDAVDIVNRWFGERPKPAPAAVQADPPAAVRASFISQTVAERRKAQYDRVLADWSSRKTPPKKASLPLGPGWSISLRREEVVPADPGDGAPAIVCGPFGKSASLTAALSTGEVTDHDWIEHEIPARVMSALETAEDYANAYIELVTQWLANTQGEKA